MSASRIKLLFILDEFPDPQAGTEGQFLLLLSRLDRSRFEPAILLLRPSAWLRTHLVDVPITVLGITRMRSPASWWRVWRAGWRARRQGFRLAHIFFNDSAMMFPLPLRLLGIETIVSRRDLGFWYTRGNLPVLRAAGRFVTAVIANSAAVRDVVVAREHIAAERVFVIHNGFRRDQAPPATAPPGLPSDGQLLVCVANLRPLKRFADAIRALPAVRAAAGAVSLVIVGEDRPGTSGQSHRAELEALAASLGVADSVLFAGKMTDPMPVVARASVCLLLSETEGLSNVVIEYMIAGKPAVCTAVGGNQELVVDGQTGFLVAVGDVDAIAARIAELLLDRGKAAQFGARAQQRARAEFSAAAMVRRHQEIYERLLAAS